MNRIALIILTFFTAIGAVAGGVGLILDTYLGMDPTLLDGTPFTSFVVPGYILLIAVGGSNLVAGLLLLMHQDHASSFAFLAGAILTVWIAVQVVMIGMVSILQPVFFTLGLVTMGLAYQFWLEMERFESWQ